jgi:hypothetical protein
MPSLARTTRSVSSAADTAPKAPTERPDSSRPVILAAPRMVALAGTSLAAPEGSAKPPCGVRPMRRECSADRPEAFEQV